MPEKLQPGPLAGLISYFRADLAVPLLRSLTVAALIRAARVSKPLQHGRDSLLVVSYLRIAIGTRFALVEAGVAQAVYLVLFSYSFFFRGFTGLTVTTGCMLTLFAAVQLTAQIRWSERFRG